MESFNIDPEDYQAMAERVSSKLVGNCEKHFERIVRMCLALEAYIAEYDMAALYISCHTELSQTFGLSACLPLSILGNTLPCSYEADIPVMLTELILHYLSEKKLLPMLICVLSKKKDLAANHYALVYAEITEAAKFFAKYTGIELVK